MKSSNHNLLATFAGKTKEKKSKKPVDVVLA